MNLAYLMVTIPNVAGFSYCSLQNLACVLLKNTENFSILRVVFSTVKTTGERMGTGWGEQCMMKTLILSQLYARAREGTVLRQKV
jgi:hypothetical protein